MSVLSRGTLTTFWNTERDMLTFDLFSKSRENLLDKLHKIWQVKLWLAGLSSYRISGSILSDIILWLPFFLWHTYLYFGEIRICVISVIDLRCLPKAESLQPHKIVFDVVTVALVGLVGRLKHSLLWFLLFVIFVNESQNDRDATRCQTPRMSWCLGCRLYHLRYTIIFKLHQKCWDIVLSVWIILIEKSILEAQTAIAEGMWLALWLCLKVFNWV